jgi:hypothetical protein
MVIHSLILNYVNKMLLEYINNNRKNFTTLMKYIYFLMLFFHKRVAYNSTPPATLTCIFFAWLFWAAGCQIDFRREGYLNL